MENEFEYYLIERKSDQAYPLIKEVGYEPDDINPTLIEIEFNDPIPRNPVLADLLKGPENYVTSKIADVIKKLNIEGVRFIATELTDPKGNVYDDYFCLNVANKIEAMDKEKSEYVYKYRVYSIRQFVLDRETLKKIPLEKRLVFRLREALSRTAFHKSVVDAIMAENPTGVQFRPIEEWTF
ncbi:hypothetical protein FACS189432_06520 [Bacteroidia bacterium]|nr:hypothetical protein FACS189426_20900 [Bacteroidia bacterium]GHT28504.1 hypothetical protein FACS189432_06520 [Bacteroidia bacterium]